MKIKKCLSVLMFLIGLNPIRGYGSLCDQKIVYPLGFMIMIFFQLLQVILLLIGLGSKMLQIKGKEVKDYYNSLQDAEQPADHECFNINKMLQEQSKVLKREMKCIFVLNSAIIIIQFIHLDMFSKYKETDYIKCSPTGFCQV